MSTQDNKSAGFFAALFDFSFEEFITSKLISFVFACGVILGALGTLVSIVSSFRYYPWIVLIAPLCYFGGVILLRIILELTMVIFKIEENTR